MSLVARAIRLVIAVILTTFVGASGAQVRDLVTEGSYGTASYLFTLVLWSPAFVVLVLLIGWAVSAPREVREHERTRAIAISAVALLVCFATAGFVFAWALSVAATYRAALRWAR